MDCDFERLCELDDHAFDVLVTRAFRLPDGLAAQEHLRAGRPIFYCDDEFGDDDIIREWPDGSRELVTVDEDGKVTVRACVIREQ
jgi:hypothetical protein